MGEDHENTSREIAECGKGKGVGMGDKESATRCGGGLSTVMSDGVGRRYAKKEIHGSGLSRH